MFFDFFKQYRRKRIVAEAFPEPWLDILHQNVEHYTYLSGEERKKLQDDLRIFLAEKNWEGGSGFTLNDEIRVTIAAQASLLTLCLEHDYFPNVETIVVYPAAYRVLDRDIGPGGIIEESEEERLGEAWDDGPIVLSWADVVSGGRDPEDGHNVVLHEFAHKLDMQDGDALGTPRLATTAQYDTWYAVMTAEFDRFVEQTNAGRETVLDEYGATNAAEFFAVATECFFEKPRQLHKKHKPLYTVLRDYYRQDPAARIVRHLRQRQRDTSSPLLGET